MPPLLSLLYAIAFTALAAMADNALAHAASTAYLQLDGDRLTWRVALRDLDARLELDADGDDQLTWGEVEDRRADIESLTQLSLELADGRAPCTLQFEPLDFERRDDAGFARIAARAHCGAGGPSRLAYRFMEGLDPSHRLLLTMPGSAAPRTLSPGALAPLAKADAQATGFAGFFADGVGHILRGIDHLMFIVALLLPAVLERRHARWVARETMRPVLVQVIWTASAFTLAHSLTLGLASFQVVRLSERVVEPLIAATVLVAALNNLKPVVTRRLAVYAFAFGLVHGFGFAEVLAPLSLPVPELAGALLAFNLGVEGGQLIVIALSLALLACVRRWAGYGRWVLGAGSMTLAVVATGWIIERVWGVGVLALVAVR